MHDTQSRENVLRHSGKLLAILMLRPTVYRRRRAAKAGLTSNNQQAHT